MREQGLEAGSEPLPAMAQRQADALARVADRALGGADRTGGDRAQVVVHVDAEVLADPAADGRSDLEGGPRVSADCGIPTRLSRGGLAESPYLSSESVDHPLECSWLQRL